MKRFIIFLFLISLIMTFTSCNAKEVEPFAIIEANDCYQNAGYLEFISSAETFAEYTFTAENSETIEWQVYVFDEAFEDGFRYISQASEPVLVGDGTISVDKGQYVYIYCSANEFTSIVADENAKLSITVN
jgi:hypothetical protein